MTNFTKILILAAGVSACHGRDDRRDVVAAAPPPSSRTRRRRISRASSTRPIAVARGVRFVIAGRASS